jgi:lipopolysaccharide transport system permease protein
VRAFTAQYGWLWASLTQRDLAQRYRGTALGTLWPFIYAGLLLAVFTLVFSVILKVRWSTGPDARPHEGALMIFAGLVPYLFLAEVLTRTPGCVTAVPNFVKKVPFPLALLPLVAVSSALVLTVINTLILLCATLMLWGTMPATAVFLPLLFLPLSLCAVGIAFILSALGVFFRDLAQASPLVAQLALFLAPICYPPSLVPPAFQTAIAWNPLTWFVGAFRDLALDNRLPLATDWAIQTLVWLIFALVGFVFFLRTRRMFADLL